MQAAIADGQTLLEIEFPPLPISKLEDSSLSAYDILSANLQFSLEFVKRLGLDPATGAPRKVALTLADAAERRRATQFFGDDEPYPGADGLEKLWNEVVEICAEEDLPRLEAEVKDKQPQEQWKILLEVRDFLVNGDAEERAAFEEWNPTVRELDDEWAGLMARVSPEEAEELAPDYAKATAEEKKRFVWDARNFLEEQEGEEEGDDGAGPPPAKAPPPRPPTDAELGGRNEGPTRRRGARGAHMEYGFDEEGVDRGDWDEFYKKEVKGSKKGSNTMLYGGACVLISLLTIVLTATAMADEEESILQSSLRLLRIG